MRPAILLLAAATLSPCLSQTAEQGSQAPGWRPAEEPPRSVREGEYVIERGTRIPLGLINSVSTKHSAIGDRVYLETVFPVLAGGRVVVPPGSHVIGTVTQVQKPGRVKGRGELYVRFDMLILPNGVTRDFRARMSALDGQAAEELDREEGKVTSAGNKAGDLKTIAGGAAAGASVGTIAGGAGADRPGLGAGIGAAAGAAAGLIGVLATRGPDAVLAKGSTVEMALDRDLTFTAEELDSGTSGTKKSYSNTPSPNRQPKQQKSTMPLPGRDYPYAPIS